MSKPYIIVHMMSSVDGRIDCAMTAQLAGNSEYYDSLDQLNAPTRVTGRVTAETEINDGLLSKESGPAYGQEGFAKHSQATAFEIIVDTHGRLQWNQKEEESHPLLILTSEAVPAAYLRNLDKAGISWIATGKQQVDLVRAMDLLSRHFGVERLAVVGGGRINGGFLSAGLVDEVSLLVGPGIDGRNGQPTIFDGLTSNQPVKLKLQQVDSFPSGAVWLRYLV